MVSPQPPLPSSSTACRHGQSPETPSLLLTPLPHSSVPRYSPTSPSCTSSRTLYSSSPSRRFFLSRPETKTPKTANFGFQFLLAFVFATIPAGIFAKVQYHDILANVDWLHGTAESLLTVTNLFIVFGMRDTREKPTENSPVKSLDSGALVTLTSLALLGALNGIGIHAEPLNALSIPTWIVHASSILEWLVAMKLIFEHAVTSGNPRWRGMTWAMVPSHTSGLCACTYHLFYNSPSLNWLVVLQSFLTLFGNTTMAIAAYRIFAFEKNRSTDTDESTMSAANPPVDESDNKFLIDMFVKSLIASLVVKYGELVFDFPFETNSIIAAAFVFIPTAANIVKWQRRSTAVTEPSTA